MPQHFDANDFITEDVKAMQTDLTIGMTARDHVYIMFAREMSANCLKSPEIVMIIESAGITMWKTSDATDFTILDAEETKTISELSRTAIRNVYHRRRQQCLQY